MTTAPVSVVVPMRDEALTVAALLEGLARQETRPAEIIFVDSGSRDGSAALVRDWWTRSGWAGTECSVINAPGAYPGGGRNAGVAASRQPWIAFLDCGIVPEPGWLRALLACAASGDGAMGRCRFEAGRAWTRALCALSYGAGAERPVLPASLFRRALFDRAGLFDPALRAGEDTLWLRALASNGANIVDCPAARVIYAHFPATAGEAMRKWFAYARSVSAAGIGDWPRRAAIMAPLLLLVLPYFAPIAGGALWLCYLGWRGVIDPMRRSASLAWWGDRPAAALLAPIAALLVDLSRAMGAIAGLLGHAKSA